MEFITTALQYVSPSALPLLLVVLFYIKIKNERKSTKESRDKDSLEIHDTLLKHSFQITALKDSQQLHNTLINDLREAVNAMNVCTAKLEVSVTSLTEAVKELKK